MTIEKARIDHYNQGKACPQMANADHAMHPLEWLRMCYDPSADPLACTLHIQGPAEILLPGDAAPRPGPYAGRWLPFNVTVSKDYPNGATAIVVSALCVQRRALLAQAADSTSHLLHPTPISLQSVTALMGPTKCAFINPVAGEGGAFCSASWEKEWSSLYGMLWMAERIKSAMFSPPTEGGINNEVTALLNGSPEAFLAAAKDAAQHAPTVPPYAAPASTAAGGASAE